MAQKPHIAMLPSPGIGHLIPMLGLAKELVHRHDFSVTFILPTIGPPPKAQKELLEGLPQGISSIFLPPPPISFVNEESVKQETKICLAVAESLSPIRDVLRSFVQSNNRPVALVVDCFGTDAFEVSMEFKIPPYVYFACSAMALALWFLWPKLDEMVSCEFRDMPEPLRLPGCVPIHGRDFPEPLQDRKNNAYNRMLHNAKRLCLAAGAMMNSFAALEPAATEALQKRAPGKLPVYPIGPNIHNSSNGKVDESQCLLEWLNDQPKGSVLFVSFGSGGTLSYEQLTELAFGLELSEERFIWVVRCPDDKSVSASFFSLGSETDPLAFLPEGFVERTKKQGLVVPFWAPQMRILSHGSTGGFVTHCGWNSILESIVNGVPLIAWPLYAEQKMNAVLLTEELKVALRPNVNQNGIVGRAEIARMVECLMKGEEGTKLRERMIELKDAARKAVSEDGSSTKTLSELVLKWKNQKNM